MYEETETFLILKYGSIQQAFQEWMLNRESTFSEAEDKFLMATAKKLYPNLNLIKGDSTRKG